MRIPGNLRGFEMWNLGELGLFRGRRKEARKAKMATMTPEERVAWREQRAFRKAQRHGNSLQGCGGSCGMPLGLAEGFHENRLSPQEHARRKAERQAKLAAMTPEERAAWEEQRAFKKTQRKAMREEKLAAMSPEQRAAWEAQRAKRKVGGRGVRGWLRKLFGR